MLCKQLAIYMTIAISCRTLVSEPEAERQGKAHTKESDARYNEDQMSQSTEYSEPPEPEPASKKQWKQHHKGSLQPTTKRAPKTTAKKKVQFNHNEVEEPVSANTGLSVIKTRSWSGLLRHRMAPGGFLTLVERLDYDQWSSIMHTGFGGMLSVRTKLIPKKLARWLLEQYDPWDNSLNLPNGKLVIDEEDVYATLGLPLGEHEIIEGQKLRQSF